ncbi:MAG: putative rRNA maturation factor [Parcubacteria group bacterium Gr01-1014_13]|nr:MAG: putative rRNA maturation factor [Parcubacteria group bacterium Gr01-1014_13]
MLSLDFNKRVKCPWTQSEIEKIFRVIEKKIKASGDLEINIVGDKEIKDLNFRYRGKNKVTDVLAFAWQEDGVIKTNSLGQIYICYPQIVRQAKEFKVKIKEEFVRMLAHGFLHIMGHDHEKKKEAEIMFKIQEEIVDEYLN